MVNKTCSCIDCKDIVFSHGETLAIAHSKCFAIPWSAKDFHELLSLPAVFGFIIYTAKDNSDRTELLLNEETTTSYIDPKGFILCLAAADQCEILTICVLPEWRRKGLASKLLRSITKRARNIGIKKIFLEVAENNNLARKLYINQGFEEFGRRQKYYGIGHKRVDAIKLFKFIGV